MNEIFLIIIVGYLLGSIPSGLIFGKLFWHTDLRQFGSHNIGATNAYRILGRRAALLVFVADALKGITGVYLGQVLLGTPTALLAGGIAVIAGHNWSIFLKFKGGRGVAAGLGVIAMLSPKVMLITFAIWLLIVCLTKYVSLASMVAAAFVPVGMWLLNETTEYIYFGILTALFIIIRHRSNLERLLQGRELKIKAGGSSSSAADRKK